MKALRPLRALGRRPGDADSAQLCWMWLEGTKVALTDEACSAGFEEALTRLFNNVGTQNTSFKPLCLVNYHRACGLEAVQPRPCLWSHVLKQ